MKKKNSLRIAELAKLVDINKRTLHYYDEIGLFSPEFKGENEYRYYTLKQVFDLSLILSLKELNMPLAEIKKVLSGDFHDFKLSLQSRLSDVDRKLEELERIRHTIDRKLHYISIAERPHMEVELISCTADHLVLSHPMENRSPTDWIMDAIAFVHDKDLHFLANNEYGTLIDVDKKLENPFTEQYDYFYIKAASAESATHTKPAGSYLRIVFQGPEEELHHPYRKLIDFSRQHDLPLDSYFYERALHDTVYDNQTNLITEIQVRVKSV